MKKILLFTNLKYLDRRVLQPCNYNNLWSDLVKQNGGNSGNKLFAFAMEKYLMRPSIYYEHYSDDMTIEYINSFFDLIIIPMANILNSNPIVKAEMEYYANYFSKIKIPVYPIGVGAQANSYDDIELLCQSIREPATRFIRAIYNTGGEFGLRGYFTKEVFDRLGFEGAVTIGCPSMYQAGRNLKIEKRVDKSDTFHVLLNGDILYLQQENLLRFLNDKSCVFMDQNEFAKLLYSHQLKSDSMDDGSCLRALIKEYTLTGLKALVNDRVKLIYDVPIWLQYIKSGNFSFSFGSRIHGNIAAILGGTPALVYYRDSRTRELAEFFDIPHINKVKKNITIQELFMQIDYNKFNANFEKKYDAFERFFIDRDILDSVSADSELERQIRQTPFQAPQIQNSEFLSELKEVLQEKKYYWIYDIFLEKYRSMKRTFKHERERGN